ncbi:hypothetical protein ACVILL_005865 [Bradyrhizobium sp. USDA 3364]
MATPAASSPRPLTLGCRADREHHLVGGDARSAGQMRSEIAAVLVDLRHCAAGDDGDATLLHLGADMLADVLVETAQDVVAAVDHRDVGAVAREDAGEFQRDVSAALDHDPLRQLLEMKRLVGGDHVLDAGNGGAVIGRAAGRDQDVFRRHLLAGGEADGVGIFQHRAGLCDPGAGLFDIRRVGGLEPGDLLVLVGDQRRPVERDLTDAPAEAGCVLDLLVDVAADHEQLLRHAAADDAGAAHPVLFGDHDLGAIIGGDAGGTNAARTTTDDKQVDVILGHGNLSLPPRPASGARSHGARFERSKTLC